MRVGGHMAIDRHAGLFCPINSESIYTSAVATANEASIRERTAEWLGGSGVVPGECPVESCCYDMVCTKKTHIGR
jgi:hypothetical protein